MKTDGGEEVGGFGEFPRAGIGGVPARASRAGAGAGAAAVVAWIGDAGVWVVGGWKIFGGGVAGEEEFAGVWVLRNAERRERSLSDSTE